jgi:C-terminal four TMM region of protein-O-mannosyltransferase/Dolichyl-phosphate-mannose-protein mannosyltransferase
VDRTDLDTPPDGAPEPDEDAPEPEAERSPGRRREEEAPRVGRRMPLWMALRYRLRRPVFVLLFIALIAGIPRFWTLGDPGTNDNGERVYVFDEVYYAKDGCLFAGYDYKRCDLANPVEQSWVHPPLGKWIIAGGIRLASLLHLGGGKPDAGVSPLGARLSAAVFGTASVVVVAGIALLLFESLLWCFVVGLLTATESLNFVQSRVALLDIFVAFWVVLGFLFLLLDRRWIDRFTRRRAAEREERIAAQLSHGPGAMAISEPPRPVPDEADTTTTTTTTTAATNATGPEAGNPEADDTWAGDPDGPNPPPLRRPRRAPAPLWRPWRFAAGLAFGAAFATKWNGFTALLCGAFLMVVWEVSRRREPGGMTVTETWLRVAAGVLIVIDGFAFGGAVAGKWSDVPALALLLLVVVPAVAIRRYRYPPPQPPGPFGSFLATLTAVALAGEGLALGAWWGGEWPVAIPGGGFVVMLVALALSESERSRREHRRNPFAETVRWEAFTLLLAMAVLPLAVYYLSYQGHITTDQTAFPRNRYHPGFGLVAPAKLLDLTGQIANFHEHLYAKNKYEDPKTHTTTFTPAHPYESRPWQWIYLGRPVSYYFVGPGAEILGIGNPIIFWFAFLTIPWLAWFTWRRRDWRAGFVLAAILFQWIPWFIPPALNKVQFLFYFTPVTGFLCLAAAYTLRDLSAIRIMGSRSRPFLPVAVGYVVVAVAAFWFFFPILTGYPLSGGAWHARMWLPSWI